MIERRSFFTELRRRNVIRAAVLYGGAAWALAQGIAQLTPVVNAPEWAARWFLVAACIGFPFWLAFAWFYEWTPEGFKREREVEDHESITHHTGRKLDFAIIGVLSLAVVLLLTDRFVLRRGVNQEADIAISKQSIAVLPFVDMSQGKDQEYFTDGISEELLNSLAKIPELKVIGRTSSFQFKGKNEDLRVIGQKLNVAHILEGSVRKSGDKIRLTAQLIRADDGTHLWSETYDRTLDDIFAVQDDIAGEVVKALKLTLLGATPVPRSKPVDSEAYNLALQGRFFFDRRGREGLERAVEYFRQSRERDPGYAPAWAGLSQAYARQADNGFVPVADGYRRAREAAERALALDPQLAEAHLAMGRIHIRYDWDWAAADARVLKALELEPGSAEAIGLASIQAVTLGRWNEAIDLANKAIERDPLRPGSYVNLGRALLKVNRDTEAEAAFRRALELDPGGAGRHYWIGVARLLQGKTDAALREMQQETDEGWQLLGSAFAFHALGRRSESDAALTDLKEKEGDIAAYQIAEAHAFRGEDDLAFEWLQHAYAQRDSGVVSIKGDRLMRGLVGDPRYKAFLRKLKLPE